MTLIPEVPGLDRYERGVERADLETEARAEAALERLEAEEAAALEGFYDDEPDHDCSPHCAVCRYDRDEDTIRENR